MVEESFEACAHDIGENNKTKMDDDFWAEDRIKKLISYTFKNFLQHLLFILAYLII